MKLTNEDFSQEVEVETSENGIMTVDSLYSSIVQLPSGVLFILENIQEARHITYLDVFQGAYYCGDRLVFGRIRFGCFSIPVVLGKDITSTNTEFERLACDAVSKYYKDLYKDLE